MEPFVCKVVILDNKDGGVLKQKKMDNENKTLRFIKASPIKKCLFGVANPEDTDRMLEEQFEIDRMRFSKKFGFDLLEIEEIEKADNIENININNEQTGIKKERKLLKARRRTTKTFKNQAVMTDFYQMRKNVQSLKKSTKDFGGSKEN